MLEREVNKMARRKKEAINTVDEKPTGWIDGAMPEPVSSLPIAPDPKPTRKEKKAAADPDPVIEKPVKEEKKVKANDGCYPATKYTGKSFMEALRIEGIDSSFISRKTIAEANGNNNYLGLGKDNKELLELFVSGKLKMPK